MPHELRVAILCLAAAGLCGVFVDAARPRDSHSPGLTAGAGRAGSGLAASLPDPATPAPVSPELQFIRDHAALLAAMEWVESGGRAHARNESENALGILQIRPVMVAECNRIGAMTGGRVDWTHGDAMDPDSARRMWAVYSAWWCDRRDDWTDEGIARRWNGGPRGHQKESTVGYWERVSGE